MNLDQKQHVVKMQKKSLEIFEIFREICETYDLQYFATAGTALGAIRHKDFIPWDDDIDICMPRPDYLRLVALLKNKKVLPDSYQFVDYLGDPSKGLVFGKIVDNFSTNIHGFLVGRPEYYTGISMDIFPLDGVPNNPLLFRVHIFIMGLLRMVKKMLGYGSFYSQHSPNFDKSRRNIFMRLACFLISKRLITAMFNGLANMYKFDSERTKYVTYVYNFVPGHSNKPFSRFLKTDFDSYIDQPFGNTTIRVPVGYDEYLTAAYGDYMKLPPKSQQVPVHSDGIVDTDFPFSYYRALHSGKVIGCTFGTFDMFHKGHLNLLRKCKQQCDYLIVGLNTDTLVEGFKHKTPIIPIEQRIMIVQSNQYVDFAFENVNVDHYLDYKEHSFHKLFSGDDYKGSDMWKRYQDSFEKNGAEVEIVFFEYTKDQSSSAIRNKLDGSSRAKS